jgi:predicted DNA-binding transcriptional regulator AlpA
MAARERQHALPVISVRIPEAVEMTGLSRSRLYKLIKSGDIEIAKIGGATVVMVDSLQSFIEGQRRVRRIPD